MSFHVPEKHRLKTGPYGSPNGIGNYGAFMIPHKRKVFRCIASNEYGWEHVSVSLLDRCPTWREMCDIKAVFWDADDVVIQYHPAEKEYINNHPYCLHLWRPIGQTVPTPPGVLVGI